MVALSPNGDAYIAEGHGNDSPNGTDADDPANNIGASRILHLDSNGNYVNQWFGNEVGPGKFNSAHGLAVDPRTAMSASATARTTLSWSNRPTACSSGRCR